VPAQISVISFARSPVIPNTTNTSPVAPPIIGTLPPGRPSAPGERSTKVTDGVAAQQIPEPRLPTVASLTGVVGLWFAHRERRRSAIGHGHGS
jgi:hypothetical protein